MGRDAVGSSVFNLHVSNSVCVLGLQVLVGMLQTFELFLLGSFVRATSLPMMAAIFEKCISPTPSQQECTYFSTDEVDRKWLFNG